MRTRKRKNRSRLPEVERLEIVKKASKLLWKPVGKDALSYLKNVKCLSDETIKSHNLGYVPKSVKINDSGEKRRHELAGRITIPIYDSYSNLAYVSSRDWREDARMKFWHESVEKSHYVYDLNMAKKHILRNHKAIVVEGEFDTLALHNNGIKYSVGILGSALNLIQIGMLARYTKEIYLAFDSDKSGQSTIEKIMSLYKEKRLDIFDISIIPVYLPSPKSIGIEDERKTDPDLLIRKKGKSGFLEMLKKAKENVVFNLS